MPTVARTMLCGAILVTVAYIAMCVVYVVGPDAASAGQGAFTAPAARAQPAPGSLVGVQPARSGSSGASTAGGALSPQPGATTVSLSASASTELVPAATAQPGGLCCDSLPAALARAVPPSEPKMVLATFCNAAFKGMLLNFAAHLHNARIPHVIGAVDREAFELMQTARSPTYLIDIGHVDGSSSHSGASWKKFAVTRTGEIAKIVALGYSVIMTDVDVLWLRDPRPYLHTCDPEAVGALEAPSCTELRGADVLASSDNLSPGKNLKQGMGDAYWGTFNTGIVVIRATAAGVAFAAKWHAYISNGPGEYAALTSDQQVFNRLVRAGPAPVDIQGKWTARRPELTLGTLPTMLFSNGHGYFVHRIERSYPGARPYAAHATYTYDGSSAQAKEQRFRDLGHWALPEPAETAAGKFLAIGAGDLAALSAGPNQFVGGSFAGWGGGGAIPLKDELGLGKHLEMLRFQLRGLRDGLALAQALGRTLVLPHFTCYCDKVWAGHDNVFNFAHMYPGAHADGNYMPFECPVDHVLQLSAWRKRGVAYRDARFAEAGGALSNKTLTIARVPGGAPDAPGTVVPPHARLVDLPATALTDEEARAQLGTPGSAAADATVLKLLPSAHGVFCAFADPQTARAFDSQFAALIGAIEPWCSECHGQVTYAQASAAELLALGKQYGETFERAAGPGAGTAGAAGAGTAGGGAAGAGGGAGESGGAGGLSLAQLLGADGRPVTAGAERLAIERVPTRADFAGGAALGTISLRSKTDVAGVASPSLVFADVPRRLWHDLTRSHAARKYSKCSDFIPPEVLALGEVHSIPSRDRGQGTQYCVQYTKLLPPPLAEAGRQCGPSGLAALSK